MSTKVSSVADAAPASESAMDSLLLGRTQELQAVMEEGEKRNWKGIFIALLVIMIMCSLIGLTVYYFSPQIVNFGNQGKKEKITLQELLLGEFNASPSNGTWLNDNQYTYRDMNGNIFIMNVTSSASCSSDDIPPPTTWPLPLSHISPSPSSLPSSVDQSILLRSNILYQQFHQAASGYYKYYLSPDRQYLMFVTMTSKVFRHSFRGIYTIFNLSDFTKYQLTDGNASHSDLQYASWGRKGSDIVFVSNDNIYYKPCVQCNFTQITTSGTNTIANGIPDWLYEEEILSNNNAIYFSPAGSKMCYASFNDSSVDSLSFPIYNDQSGDSKIFNIRYPRPGKNNPTIKLNVVDLSAAVERSDFTLPVTPPPEILQRQDYYYTSVSWVDESNLLVTWLTREQTLGSISICSLNVTLQDAYTCRTIKPLTSTDGWVELYQEPVYSVDRKFVFFRLPSFQTDNSGTFRHIASIPLDGSRDIKFITSGLFDTINIIQHVQLDENNKYLYYTSTLPSNAGVSHLFKVKTHEDANKFSESTCVTCNLGPECKYNDVQFSSGGSFYTVNCMGPGVPRGYLRKTCPAQDTPEPSLLITSNDRLRQFISKKAMPRIKEMTVPLEDGYNASVRLLLPPNLSESEISRYPLLINVYGGPGNQMVTSKFRVDWGYYLASNRNIIYGVIDGRGSGNRGDKYLYTMYKQLGTVEVEDQIRVTKYLTQNLPYIRKDRVGIWGWSYGGYVAAMALASDTSKPSVFSCGMSVAPVSDWLLYDSAYTERYMSLPRKNWANYQKSSLLNKAREMWGKRFLLIHGTADDNVHISQSMLLMRALSSQNVIYSSQVYPDENHSLAGVTRHLYTTMEDFINGCFSLDVIYDDVGLRRSVSRRTRMNK